MPSLRFAALVDAASAIPVPSVIRWCFARRGQGRPGTAPFGPPKTPRTGLESITAQTSRSDRPGAASRSCTSCSRFHTPAVPRCLATRLGRWERPTPGRRWARRAVSTVSACRTLGTLERSGWRRAQQERRRPGVGVDAGVGEDGGRGHRARLARPVRDGGPADLQPAGSLSALSAALPWWWPGRGGAGGGGRLISGSRAACLRVTRRAMTARCTGWWSRRSRGRGATPASPAASRTPGVACGQHVQDRRLPADADRVADHRADLRTRR